MTTRNEVLPAEQCVLIDGVIYCQCGDQSSHYGTMGERGAREVRCEAPRSADSLVTKDGIRVEIGQIWRDCDERMSGGNRRCRVVALNPAMGKVQMENIHGPFKTWVSVRRMHKHSTGWEIVR